MKNTISIIILLFWMSAIKIYAQQIDNNKDIEVIFKRSKKPVSWSGIMTLNYHQKISNVKPGIALEATINKHFILGAFAQFTTGNFAKPYNNYQNNIITQDFGILIGATQDPAKLFHLGGQLKVGTIFLQADSTAEISPFRPFKATGKDNGITVYPELNATLNLTEKMKLRAGSGFNFLLLKKESILKDRQLDSWFLNMSIIWSFKR